MNIRRWAVNFKRKIQWGLLEYDRYVYENNPPLKNNESIKKTYILPADAPGGIGDDAMVGGVVKGLQEIKVGEVPVILAPSTFKKNTPFAEGADISATQWQWSIPLREVKGVQGNGSLIVLGADILDGHYSYIDAVKRIRMARYAKDLGLDSRIVGFSLNDSPHPKVIEEFNRLDGKVPLYLRDPISFKRAKTNLLGNIHLSADVAFMLTRKQTSYTNKVKLFVDSFKAKDLLVIGLNMHDLFARNLGTELVEKINQSLAAVVESHSNCGFVFIPHDFRSFIDDRIPLRRIFSLLSESARERVFLVNEPIRASEIKEICSELDGVFTGRMHLAIAALGCGTPIFGIVYQGKFEGLLEHFQLDDRCVVDPISVAKYDYISERFDDWIMRLNELKLAISLRIEYVNKLSLSNLK